MCVLLLNIAAQAFGKLTAGYAEAVAALAHPGVTLTDGLTRVPEEGKKKEVEGREECATRIFFCFVFEKDVRVRAAGYSV